MDSGRERIGALLAPYGSGRSPGCAVGVFERGELAFARGAGMASLEYDVPITARTVFRVASTSKQFTAAVILDLADRGLIDLDGD
ncbi:MAG TPA: serine hydrolase domain-containing protein, partial [Polyangia bacterium]|nr:serine hydrolase domain-containing protein [Polyangia bacterium]